MPQILMEMDLHGPDIDARGATFPGVNLYVLLGRGQDYAWSATSAGQDIIDTFAEKLCEPDGVATPDGQLDALPLQGRVPGDGDPRARHRSPTRTRVTTDRAHAEPPMPYTLKAQRTVHGIVSKRGHRRRRARRLRQAPLHLLPRGRLGARLLRPEPALEGAERRGLPAGDERDQLHLQLVLRGRQDIAYFNSGWNPVRAEGTDPEFPTWGTGEWDWQNFDPVLDPAPGCPAGSTPRTTRPSPSTRR